jgi:ketosteroid isomerase-like protein
MVVACTSEAAVADTTSIIALLEGVCDAFNAHDLDRIMEFFAEDCILQMPRGPDPDGRRYEGKAAVREGLATRFAGLPDVHFGHATHYACGDTGISKWTITGITPSGEHIEALGCDFYTFREGAVIAKDSYWKRVDPA